MHGYLRRDLRLRLEESLSNFPAVAILGPRQAGKTTLAKDLIGGRPNSLYLDLERPSDLRKLDDAELFLESWQRQNPDGLVCIDEIQRAPELFPVLRALIDAHGGNGQLLILGSASQDLIRQSSESLAGRILFLELTPLLATEVGVDDRESLLRYWLRGGFPRSYLAPSDEASLLWRESFGTTFLERDVPQLGFQVPPETLRRLWKMLAHHHGQFLNSSQLGSSLGVSHTTLRSYVDLLTETFMIRQLPPFEGNVGKRLVKSPRVYVRDSGILHSLLEIGSMEELFGHPVVGASWEGLVIENVLAALPRWTPSFYRTSHGAEIDLILSRGQRRIAIECKASSSPHVRRGFWTALEDTGADEAWVVAPVEEVYPLREGVRVAPLGALVRELGALGSR